MAVTVVVALTVGVAVVVDSCNGGGGVGGKGGGQGGREDGGRGVLIFINY